MRTEIFISLISLLAGAFVTWIVARYYYMRAGDELRQEASELRKLNSMILQALEKKGWVKLDRDASGKILGFVFEYAGSGEIHLGISSETEFVQKSNKEQLPK